MSLDLATIPTERLALLDQATLFHGPHGGGTGGPDCKHCARELLHEVVTGKHADRTPPGLSIIVDMLPGMNDGPWRDDAHRTAVMRPYLTKILVLDPARDTDRVYALLDYICRDALSAFLDAVLGQLLAVGRAELGVGDQCVDPVDRGEADELLTADLRRVGHHDDEVGAADHGSLDGGLIRVGGGQAMPDADAVGANEGCVDA